MGCRDLMLFEKDDTVETLADYCRQAAFVVHLAGINRPKNPSEFYSGNAGLTDTMLHLLEKSGNRAPVLVTSSIQAALDNDYGKSKKQAEDAIFAHGKNTGAPVYVFRMEASSASGAAPTTTAWWQRSAITLPGICPSRCGTPPTNCRWSTLTM